MRSVHVLLILMHACADSTLILKSSLALRCRIESSTAHSSAVSVFLPSIQVDEVLQRDAYALVYLRETLVAR